MGRKNSNARRLNRGKPDDFSKVADNLLAIRDGAPKKTYHLLDMDNIQPKTKKQKDYIEYWVRGNHTAYVLSGCAGTGKTFLALHSALSTILKEETPQNKVIIVRSTVSIRTTGFLPGTLDEKLAPYETPYISLFDEIFKYKKSYENMKQSGKVVFMPTEFVRGITLDDAIVVVDECQNLNYQELLSISTRLGSNSKIIYCGDTKQNDLVNHRNDSSGYESFINKILLGLQETCHVKFGVDDVVRSDFVGSLLKREYELNG